MLSFRITLETLTPLFLGGAEARGAPELRPPAFRGALRYWLRAAIGGNGHNALEKMRELEGRVFGSAGDGNDGSSSTILIRNGAQNFKTVSYSQIVEAHKTPDGKVKIGKTGLSYLFFAARSTRNEPERSGLSGTFEIVMQARFALSSEKAEMRQAYAALWLLTHIGGLGSRAKRGGGNIQVIKIDPIPQFATDLPLLIGATSPVSLAQELTKGISVAKKWLNVPSNDKETYLPDFDVLDTNTCKIWVIDKEFDTSLDALNSLGLIYQGFRKWRKPDYDTVKNAMKTGQNLVQPVQRAAFGLPIPYLYRSLDKDQSILQANDFDRRASPISFRVLKLANKKFALVVVWFKSRFLPSQQKLKLIHHKAERFGNAPSDTIINDFLTGKDNQNQSSLQDKGWKLIEVIL